MTRDEFLKVISEWYRPEVLSDFFSRLIAPEVRVRGAYEALRHQQTDGSYYARYYVCTDNQLLILKVSGADLRLGVYQLALLQKVGGKIPAAPGQRTDWAQGEWVFRFGVGHEIIRPVYPDDEKQREGYFAVLRHLLNY